MHPKDTRIYTGLGQSPMSSLRDDRVRVPYLNALKFLQWGCKNGGRGRRMELELEDGLNESFESLMPWKGALAALYRVRG
jgi:hypothetical protein